MRWWLLHACGCRVPIYLCDDDEPWMDVAHAVLLDDPKSAREHGYPCPAILVRASDSPQKQEQSVFHELFHLSAGLTPVDSYGAKVGKRRRPSEAVQHKTINLVDVPLLGICRRLGFRFPRRPNGWKRLRKTA